MNRWGLIAWFIALILLALTFILYPFRQVKKGSFLIAILSVLGMSVAYWYCGSFKAWHDFLLHQEKQKRVQAFLQTVKNPLAIIEKLKIHLQTNPESARGWYLLGKLYASQGLWELARDGFAKALKLKPEDEIISVNYAQSLWQLNQGKFNDFIRNLLKNVLQKHPNQPDALSLLAMDAFMTKNYQLSLDYWQQLLKQAQDPTEIQMLRQAIAKAERRIRLLKE